MQLKIFVADVIGVVLSVSRSQDGLNFRKRPNRHVVLMDARSGV